MGHEEHLSNLCFAVCGRLDQIPQKLIAYLKFELHFYESGMPSNHERTIENLDADENG